MSVRGRTWSTVRSCGGSVASRWCVVAREVHARAHTQRVVQVEETQSEDEVADRNWKENLGQSDVPDLTLLETDLQVIIKVSSSSQTLTTSRRWQWTISAWPSAPDCVCLLREPSWGCPWWRLVVVVVVSVTTWWTTESYRTTDRPLAAPHSPARTLSRPADRLLMLIIMKWISHLQLSLFE